MPRSRACRPRPASTPPWWRRSPMPSSAPRDSSTSAPARRWRCSRSPSSAASPRAATRSIFYALTAGLAILTGVFFIVAGLAKLGFLADFMSRPVLDGFIVGLAMTIAAGPAAQALRHRGDRRQLLRRHRRGHRQPRRDGRGHARHRRRQPGLAVHPREGHAAHPGGPAGDVPGHHRRLGASTSPSRAWRSSVRSPPACPRWRGRTSASTQWVGLVPGRDGHRGGGLRRIGRGGAHLCPQARLRGRRQPGDDRASARPTRPPAWSARSWSTAACPRPRLPTRPGRRRSSPRSRSRPRSSSPSSSSPGSSRTCPRPRSGPSSSTRSGTSSTSRRSAATGRSGVTTSGPAWRRSSACSSSTSWPACSSRWASRSCSAGPGQPAALGHPGPHPHEESDDVAFQDVETHPDARDLPRPAHHPLRCRPLLRQRQGLRRRRARGHRGSRPRAERRAPRRRVHQRHRLDGHDGHA